MLYLFQSKQVETGRKISAVLGKNEATIYRWLFQYKEGGMENLLKNGRFLVAQKSSQLKQQLHCNKS
jgi:transposase